MNPQYGNISINEGNAAQYHVDLRQNRITRGINTIVLRGVFEDIKYRKLQYVESLNANENNVKYPRTECMWFQARGHMEQMAEIRLKSGKKAHKVLR